jgi:hypothetical protein
MGYIVPLHHDLFLRAQADADLDGDFGAAPSMDGKPPANGAASFAELTSKQREVAAASLPRNAKVGLYKSSPVVTHSLKGAWFQPLSL